MMKTTVKKVIFALAVVGLFVALLAPGSPFNLPNYLSRDLHNGRAIRDWVREVKSTDGDTRLQAIIQVGKIGTGAKEAIPELGRLLSHDDDRNVRVQASFSLIRMAPDSSIVLDDLTVALKDPEPSVRFNAILALQNLKADARPALPALLEALKDDSNHTNARTFIHTVHQSIIRSLGPITAGTADAVPVLLTYVVTTQPPQTRVSALLALKDIGEPIRSSAPKLRLLAKDQDEEIRLLANEALQKIGEPLAGPTEESSINYELPESDRKYLWKIENGGNLLVKHGFGPLANALKSGDRAALAKALAPDFIGGDISNPRIIQTKSGVVDIERIEETGQPPHTLTAERFLNSLMGFREVFKEAAPGVKFNMMTLSPKVHGQLDSPVWVGTVQLRLHGESVKGAPAEIVAVLRYEIAFPNEEELTKPGWIKRAEFVQVLTAKSRQPLFVDTTKQVGLKTEGLYDNWDGGVFMPTTGGVFVTDFDHDGLLDVLITDINGSTLYRGTRDGTFVDCTEKCGLKSDQIQDATAVWVDLDGDGWDDLILGRRIFRNEQGKKFTDVTSKCNLRLPDTFSNIVVADYDRDGKLDLYITRPGAPGGNSWLDHRKSDAKGNYLFRNLGDWKFEDVTKATRTEGGSRSTFSAAWLDANNDGWPDLFVPNEFGDGVLLINQKDGTFKEMTLSDKPADFGTIGLAVGDMDNDGNIDIFCNNMYSKAASEWSAI
ncbi:MAG: FG-GAP-like repeat-containing protein [Gemmataceae bacterium]